MNGQRALALAIGALCLGAAARLGPGSANDSALARLLAPVSAPLVARELVLADHALSTGRAGLALEHLARAQRLRPSATAPWERLVEFQGLALASALREPSGERRRDWLRSALASAESGVSSAENPARVARTAALVLAVQAESDPPPPWPGGVPGLFEAAAAWFRRAAAGGDVQADSAARWCEVQAALAADRDPLRPASER